MDNTVPPYSELETNVCKRICRFDPSHSYCTGCYRTLAEIKEWKTYSAIRQNTIIQTLYSRQEEIIK